MSTPRIRIRNERGKVVSETGRFLELLDMDGKVALLFVVQDGGVIKQIAPGTVEAKRYAAKMNVEWCEKLILLV